MLAPDMFARAFFRAYGGSNDPTQQTEFGRYLIAEEEARQPEILVDYDG